MNIIDYLIKYWYIVLAFITAIFYAGTYVAKINLLYKKSFNIDNNLNEIKNDIKSINGYFRSLESLLLNQGVLKNGFYGSSSPISLKEKGIKALKESKFINIFNENKEALFNLLKEKIEKNPTKTKYDLQVIAIEIMRDLQNDKMIIPVKNYVYEKGLDLNEILIAMGLYLRDKFLEEFGNEY